VGDNPTVARAPTTRYARSGELHIAYQVAGEGPIDVVYVPTWISQVEHIWEEPRVARFFERIASFARLILFDRRGSGLSDPAPAPTLEGQMDDVLAVLDAVGSERAAIFAQVEGGAMAAMFAATHPERTGALVLFAAWARILRDVDYEWANPPEVRDALVEEMLADWGIGKRAGALAPSAAGEPRFVEWFGRLQRLGASPGTAREMLHVVGDYDVRSVLPTIRVPTLVMHRAGDEAIDPRHSRYLADHIPGARYQELPGRDSLAAFGDARWRELLVDHDTLVRRELDRHRGRFVKSTGDGVLATFDGPARAILCATTIVDAARELGLELRAGLHTGECEVIGDDVGGLAVHIAARVSQAAGPAEVLVSSTVKDLVVGSRIEFGERGMHDLRGVPGEWRLFEAV
jgi:pimeloyl-ACP methyl ester carboxylesterase